MTLESIVSYDHQLEIYTNGCENLNNIISGGQETNADIQI